VVLDGDNEYSVYRTNTRGRTKLTVRKQASGKHKYGNELYYLGVGWNEYSEELGKSVSRAFTLSRLIYAWFIGDVPDKIDVDHIDNNTMNNRLDNLQLLTRRENILKRPRNGANQYTNNKVNNEYFAKTKEERMKLKEERIKKIEREKELAPLKRKFYQEKKEKIMIIKQKIKSTELELKKLKEQWHEAAKEQFECI